MTATEKSHSSGTSVTASQLDLLILQHAPYRRTLQHALPERGIVHKFAHGQLAPDAPGVEQQTLPIRLRHTPATCWVRPVAGIKLGVGRRLYITGDAEQRAESVERVEAPVEAKREFVEVGL
jgi:hypothetical protein